MGKKLDIYDPDGRPILVFTYIVTVSHPEGGSVKLPIFSMVAELDDSFFEYIVDDGWAIENVHYGGAAHKMPLLFVEMQKLSYK